VGQGEDEMEISDGQQFLLPLLKPPLLGESLTLGAVTVAAGVVAGQLVATGIAAIQMAAEGGGATAFDQRHHLQSIARQGMLGSVAFAVQTEDVGYFPAGPPAGWSRSRRPFGREYLSTRTGEHGDVPLSSPATREKAD
jgi:hypothetical protein